MYDVLVEVVPGESLVFTDIIYVSRCSRVGGVGLRREQVHQQSTITTKVADECTIDIFFCRKDLSYGCHHRADGTPPQAGCGVDNEWT